MKQSADSKERQPGVSSLIAFAIIILAAWQTSSFLFAITGPVEAVLYWFFSLTGIVKVLPYMFVVGLVSCLCLACFFLFFLSRVRNQRAWNTLMRDFLPHGIKHEAKAGPAPIQGVELVSLPFAPQQILTSAMRGGFDWTSPYSPYKYAHWVALHKELREFSFELEIGPLIGLRFWVPHGHQGDDELKILSSSLQTSYGNIDLSQARSVAIPAILGTPRFSPTFRKEIAAFGNEFVSVVLLEGIPAPDSEGTHLDKLIHALTELEICASFVVHCSRTRNQLRRLVGRGQESDLSRDALLSSRLNRLRSTQQTNNEQALGRWRVSAYLVVRTRDSKSHLSKVKSAKIILETTFLNPAQPIKTTVLKGRPLHTALASVLRRDSVGRTRTLSSQQVSLLVHLPQQAQPGVYRKYSAEFEVPPEKHTEISLFKAMKNDRVLYPVGIDLSQLATHMVIVGQTGKGKTHFVGNLLQQVKKFPNVGIAILDWKGEYRSLVETVYAIGTEDCPLKINLFETHGTSSVEEYVQDLVSLLRELMAANVESSLSAQMERILRESLVEYLKRGRGSYEGYEAFLHSWIQNHEQQFSQPESSLAGLLNRFGTMFRGRLGRVFNTEATTRDFSLLLRDRVCFDLSKLAAYSKEDARLFLNTLLMLLRAYLFRDFSDKLRYLVVAEEAQYLVPEVFGKRSTADASPAEDIALFQRAYGVGLVAVSTRPNLISRNILANSGCKILFQCPLDSDFVADIVNLSSAQRQQLSQMPDRVVLAQLPWFEHPFKAQIEEFRFPSKQQVPPSSLHVAKADEPLPDVTKQKETNTTADLWREPIGPVARHFLDLACTALYNQGILHRIIGLGHTIAIDIPRHSILLAFVDSLEALKQLDTLILAELALLVVAICPPKLISSILDSQDTVGGGTAQGSFANSPAMMVPLTHNELRRLARQIKTGRLATSRVTPLLRHSPELPPVK